MEELTNRYWVAFVRRDDNDSKYLPIQSGSGSVVSIGFVAQKPYGIRPAVNKMTATTSGAFTVDSDMAAELLSSPLEQAARAEELRTDERYLSNSQSGRRQNYFGKAVLFTEHFRSSTVWSYKRRCTSNSSSR
eukprot:scpid96282/ scgid32722/ 